MKKKKGKGGALKFVVLGVAVLLLLGGLVTGVMLYLNALEVEEQRNQALEQLMRGNYAEYAEAARVYDGLIAAHPDDQTILAEAARVHAMTALEFGTDDDDRAMELIHEAASAEASEQQLAPARAAVDIYRGDLMHADKVLNATNSSTGEYAPELLYLRGLWYLRQDNPREAIRRFSAAIQAAPQDIRMSLAQASALYAQNNHPMALKQLEDLEELAPRNVSSRLLQANINIESGRHPEGGEQMAREVLETLSSEASPGQLGWAKLLRARYFYISKNKLQARELVLDARSSRPVRDPEFSALTARTLLDLGDPEGAREEAKRAVELSPHLGRYRLLLAEALLEVGDYSAAEEHLRPVTNSPKAALLQGRIYLAREDLAGAERRFEEAAAGEREAPQAKLFLSEIYLRQNRTKQAIQVLEKLAEGPPALPEARILLGEAYLDTNQLDQAEKVLEQAQGELPNDPRVSIGLGKVFARKGQQERAIQAVQKALNIDPEQPDALATLGQLQLSMGNREEATQSFDKALELRPTHGDALIGRARVATAEREFASAAEYLQKAEGKVPSGYLELAKGELELRRYQPAKAVEHLEKAVEALPRERIAYALLGDANVLRGDSSSLRRARSAYAKALEIQSNDPRSLIGLAEIAIVGTSISRTTRAIEKAAEAIEGADVTATLAARMQTLKGRFEFEINGDASAARAPLERALELDANLAEAHLSFAFVADEQSRSSEACEHFRRYLELFENGQSQDVSDARSGVSKNCR